MASEAGGDARCGIGTRLRAAREKRGLTILQAAERLHVDARVLDHLEAEDFAALDAPVYVRGHLRRYAELVGESPLALQELYSGTQPGEGPDLTRIPHRELDGSSSPHLALPVLLVVAAVALGWLLWWVLTLPTPKPQPVLTVAPAAGAAGAGAPASSGARAESGAPQPAAGTAARAGDAHLALRFAAASWVEVYDASGRRLLQGLSEADSARTLVGPPPLRVVLGNAPGVAVRVNGEPVKLEGLVRRDGSARFLLDSAGHAAPAPPLMAHGG